MHAIGLVHGVYGTVLVVAIAQTKELLTAPIGILGALAGYLLGSAAAKSRESKHT